MLIGSRESNLNYCRFMLIYFFFCFFFHKTDAGYRSNYNYFTCFRGKIKDIKEKRLDRM